MTRLVIDPNVYISGLISSGRSPAELVDMVRYRDVIAVTCPHLLDKLENVLRRPRFRRYMEPAPNPTDLDDIDCRDPADRYLIALARNRDVDALVSGDHDLTTMPDPTTPILTPDKGRDRFDPVPKHTFQAARGTFTITLAGPKSAKVASIEPCMRRGSSPTAPAVGTSPRPPRWRG